jgi:hypothetical protein
MTNSTLLVKTGANNLLANGISTTATRFRVSINTTDPLWSDTVLTTTVTINAAMYKAIESILTDTTDASVQITSKLTVSEANGNLLDGYAIEDSTGSPIMAIKTKHTANSKSNTDLFKYTTKVRLRNINQ